METKVCSKVSVFERLDRLFEIADNALSIVSIARILDYNDESEFSLLIDYLKSEIESDRIIKSVRYCHFLRDLSIVYSRKSLNVN